MFSLHKAPSRVSHRRVVALAWPIVVSMLSYTAMNIVDVLLVGRLGTDALAAVGLSITLSFAVLSFGNGLLRGVKVTVAQRTGAGDDSAVERLLWQALWLTLALGVVVSPCAFLAPAFTSRVVSEPGAAQAAGVFLAIRLAGAPLSFGMTALSSWLQGRGDTRTPMFAVLASHLVNIALDLVLVFGAGPVPALGVPGAALASVLAWLVAVSILLPAVSGTLRRTSARPDAALLLAVWRVGSPMGLQVVLDVASFAVFSVLLASVGAVQLAAHVLTIRIISVSFLPGYAIGEAGEVLVGHAVGARRFDDARSAWANSCRVALAVMLAWGVVFVTVPDALIGVFGAEPAVAEVARKLLFTAVAFQLFDGIQTVSFGALNGAGDTRFAMISSGLVGWFVKIPIAYVLAVYAGWGAVGAWIGLSGEIGALAAVNLWRITSGRWLAVARREPAAALVSAHVEA